MKVQNVRKGNLQMIIDCAYYKVLGAFFRQLKLNYSVPKHSAFSDHKPIPISIWWSLFCLTMPDAWVMTPVIKRLVELSSCLRIQLSCLPKQKERNTFWWTVCPRYDVLERCPKNTDSSASYHGCHWRAIFPCCHSASINTLTITIPRDATVRLMVFVNKW